VRLTHGVKFWYVSTRRPSPVLFCFLILPLLPAVLAAQTRKPPAKSLPPSAFQLISVKVSGTQRFKPEDVALATGLQLGQTVHEDDFKDAARRLGDTGAFADVAYSFEYSPDGTKLELQVHDAGHFVPARFDNLVWFSDQELLDKLHAQVPLFNGQLPVTGKLPDDVSEALQVLLINKKGAGRVDYVRVGKEDGPTEAFAFSVTGRITIRNVEFTGAGPTELTFLQAAAKRLQGAEYARPALHTQEEKAFLPVYLERGFLRATFGDPQAKVVESDQDETQVDVTFPVIPGPQYRPTKMEVAGYKALPVDTLRKTLHLELNQPVNAVQLANDVDTMKRIYGAHGYMAATIKIEPEIDDSQHTVKYRLSINEGDVYKMGDLDIFGLDSHTRDHLQNEWTLRAGDTYDSSYPGRFLQQVYKEIGDWNVDVHETLTQKDKTVDVTLRFESHQ
jgi:outer membrane protein assembly factor BamA